MSAWLGLSKIGNNVLFLLHHPRGSESGNTDQVAAGLVQASEEHSLYPALRITLLEN